MLDTPLTTRDLHETAAGREMEEFLGRWRQIESIEDLLRRIRKARPLTTRETKGMML